MSNIIKVAFLVVGAILVALIVHLVLSRAGHTEQPVVATLKVRVSAADLPQGLLLRDEDIRWDSVPVEKVPTGAIVADAPGAVELKGALLRHPVSANTVLVSDDVILPNAPGFLAATLKPDMRAVSVAVDDVSGNAGLIQPGDYVDLILTQRLDQSASTGRSVVSETVVEHVRVLASGSEIVRPKSGDTPGDMRSPARTVTLEVTPHMGEAIAVAARLGSLSLALRSFATESRNPHVAGLKMSAASDAGASLPAPVWSGDISRALRDQPRAINAAAPAAVTIYRGSTQSDALSANVSASAGGQGGGMPPLPSGVSTPVLTPR